MIRSLLPRVLIACLLLPPAAHPAEGSRAACRKVEYAAQGGHGHEWYDLNSKYRIVTDTDHALDTPGDFGLRMMLYKKTGNTWSRVYVSKGELESYVLRPAFVKNCGGHELLIFAETATEYSWGVEVLAFDRGGMARLGFMDVVVEGTDSVIPFMKFDERHGAMIISFTREVILHADGKDGKKIPKSQIRYRIKGNSLIELYPG